MLFHTDTDTAIPVHTRAAYHKTCSEQKSHSYLLSTCLMGGLKLMHLHRIALGPLLLGDLPAGLASVETKHSW